MKMAQLYYKIQITLFFLLTINNRFKVQTCKLDSLNLNCNQNCLKSQKCNFDIRKELQVKEYLNIIPSLQIAFSHCFLKCNYNNNDYKTKSKLKLSVKSSPVIVTLFSLGKCEILV